MLTIVTPFKGDQQTSKENDLKTVGTQLKSIAEA